MGVDDPVVRTCYFFVWVGRGVLVVMGRDLSRSHAMAWAEGRDSLSDATEVKLGFSGAGGGS